MRCRSPASGPGLRERVGRWPVVVLIGCQIVASGCSGGRALPASGADAPADSTAVLNLANWADFMSPAAIEQFEKAYQVRIVNNFFSSESELETKLLVGHSNFDVVVPDGGHLERQIRARIYQPLAKEKVANLRNIDPEVMQQMAAYDPGNRYGAPYMRSSVGIGYDLGKITTRMANAPLDSWRMIFDPAVVSKFKDCGIALLDDPSDVLAATLIYLGKQPYSESPADFDAAEQVLLAMRPYVRTITSDEHITAFANGEICLALVWSGDITQARDRAREANKAVQLVYKIPKEGSISILDTMAIPADAPHPENALKFINFMLRPDIGALNATTTRYASPLPATRVLLDPTARADEGVYPPAEVRERLVPGRARDQAFTQLMTRMWLRFKSGT